MVSVVHGVRFGIDARWFRTGPPSGRNYVRHLIGALAARDDSEEFAAFAAGAAVLDIRQLGLGVVTTLALPSFAFNLASIPARTPRSMRAVLHQNFTPLWCHARSVTLVHDLIFLRRPEQFTRSELAYLSLIPLLLPRAAVVVTVSEHVKAEVLERWPRRDPASVMVAPNGISDALLDDGGHGLPPRGSDGTIAREAAEARVGRDHGRPYVLYLGRLNRRKNLVRLVEAFAVADLADHELVIAGPDDGAAREVRAAAVRTGISSRIRLVGRVSDREVRSLLAGADSFAYVSLDEGFGVPPLEAMALGVPVVVSDIPALRETAAGGGAVLVAPDDVEQIAEALRRVTFDEAVRLRARGAGPAHARGFRWAVTAGRVRLALERAAT